MKDALAVLADLFSKGYLDPEFGVKDTDQYMQLVANNKVGMHYAEDWNNWILNDAVLANEGTMDWYPMQIVSADSEPALPALSYPVSTFTVVNSDFEYPEALIKLTNVYLKHRFEEPNPDVYAVDAEGVGYASHSATGIVSPGKSVEIEVNDFYELRDSTANQDFSILEGSDYSGWYDPICAFLYEGTLDGNGWVMARMAGPEHSSFGVLIDIYENDRYIDQAFGGLTDTMVEKWSTLENLELQVMTKIIMGQEPVSSFDDFVAEWKELGGDQILAEINNKK
jgi:putative aldouronate transport system substrate-binding protein